MSILQCAKNLGIRHNVSIRVIDPRSGDVVSEHIGHNAATNSMLTGIAHYLTGDGILNQGFQMLSAYVPQYISLGTMGLHNQEEDENGLPAGIGPIDYLGSEYKYNKLPESDLIMLGKLTYDADGKVVDVPGVNLSEYVTAEDAETLRYVDYITQCPGYGADGYDNNLNNNRREFGLGPVFEKRSGSATVNCELISTSFPRATISFRDVVPETEAELPQTIDVVFSAMISTGALAQFREDGKDYIFITEAGLWSKPNWTSGGDNGLLAGYRIAPPNTAQWDMYVPENRQTLKEQIIRVGKNQVVQVIWKIQLGSIEQLGGIDQLYHPEADDRLRWTDWYGK